MEWHSHQVHRICYAPQSAYFRSLTGDGTAASGGGSGWLLPTPAAHPSGEVASSPILSLVAIRVVAVQGGSGWWRFSAVPGDPSPMSCSPRREIDGDATAATESPNDLRPSLRRLRPWFGGGR